MCSFVKYEILSLQSNRDERRLVGERGVEITFRKQRSRISARRKIKAGGCAAS